jgi:hypothetical protein
MPVKVNFIAGMTCLEQNWNMFSPPLINDGWYMMKGEFRNGGTVHV